MSGWSFQMIPTSIGRMGWAEETKSFVLFVLFLNQAGNMVSA